jgi:methylmalonyl-CoA epimerase
MTVQRIDHTAIAVHDLDEALPRYEALYGVTRGERAVVPDQRVEVAFLPIGDTSLELISPLDDESGVARFLANRGEGLHHLAVAVPDIRKELERLRAAGVRLIDNEPRSGFHGEVAFVHPRGTGGVLLELVQLPS